MTVKPELWLQNATGAGVVSAVLEQVPVPAAEQPSATPGPVGERAGGAG